MEKLSMTPVRLLGLFLLLVVGLVGVRLTQADEGPDLFAYRDAETVQLGEALYGEYCAACHGADLSGEPNWRDRDAEGYLPAPPHDESGHTWHHPTGQLFQITKFGTEALVGNGYRSNMAAFGDALSDGEIRAILAYIKSTWPAEIIERHDELDAAYAEAAGS